MANRAFRLKLPPLPAVALLGIASGLPLVLVGDTLRAWMKSAQVDIRVIGLLALVGLPYNFKFLWSPLMDRFRPFFGGRRRGWIVLTQLALMLSLSAMAFLDLEWYATAPGLYARIGFWAALILMAFLALATAFFSASQDIVTDAYRTEVLEEKVAGLGASLAIFGYRVGMIIAGAFALWLSDRTSWRVVYLVMAAFLLPGVLTAFLSPEPEAPPREPRTLREAVVEPFVEFWGRRGALEVLVFIAIYKVADMFAVNLQVPFLLDLGFTRSEIGLATKGVGMTALIVGGITGGVLMERWDLGKSLWRFGLLQAAANLLPFALSLVGKNYPLMFAVLGSENFLYGLGVTASTTLMMRLCNRSFTATQYALLSSIAVLSRVLLVAPGGFLQKAVGWPAYFAIGATFAIPGLLLLRRYKRWELPGDGTNQKA
jgi:PAT family beta-lactamase induction signal transducer AmpG